MFVIKAKAEVKSANLRSEYHGDERVPAITLRFAAEDVDARELGSMTPDLITKFWSKAGEPELQEFAPHRLRHTIENCLAVITVGRKKITLTGCDVKRLDFVPRQGVRAQVTFNINAAVVINPLLHQALRDEVKVEIAERQLSLPAMEQPAAAAKGDGAAPPAKKKAKKKAGKKKTAKKAAKKKRRGRPLGSKNKRPRAATLH